MGQNLREYDPPVVVDRIVGLSRRAGVIPPPGSPGASFQGCIEVEGRYSDYDVFIQVSPEWLDVTLRVVMESGSISQTLDLKAIRDLPMTYSGQIVQGGATDSTVPFNSPAFAIRGRKCDKLRLEAFHTGIEHPQAKFRIEARPPGGIYGDRANRLPIDPFAAPTQQLNVAQLLTGIGGQGFDLEDNQGAPVLVNPIPGGRIALTRLELSHDEEVPVLYTITSDSEGGVVSVVKALPLVHPGAHWISPMTYPLRGIPNGTWRIVPSVFSGGAVHTLNATGYLE